MKVTFPPRTLRAKLSALLCVCLLLMALLTIVLLSYGAQHFFFNAEKQEFSTTQISMMQEMSRRIDGISTTLVAFTQQQDFATALTEIGQDEHAFERAISTQVMERLSNLLISLHPLAEGDLLAFNSQHRLLAFADTLAEKNSNKLVPRRSTKRALNDNVIAAKKSAAASLARNLSNPYPLIELELEWAIIDNEPRLVIWVPITRNVAENTVRYVGSMAFVVRNINDWFSLFTKRDNIHLEWVGAHLPRSSKSPLLNAQLLNHAPLFFPSTDNGTTQTGEGGIFDSTQYFGRVFRVPYQSDKPLYLVLSLEKHLTWKKVGEAALYNSAAIAIAGIMVFLLGLVIMRKYIVDPIAQISRGIAAIKRGHKVDLGQHAHAPSMHEVLDSYRALFQSSRAHQQETRLWKAVFGKTREAIFIANHEGKIIQINEAFTDITGYKMEEALGHLPGFLRDNINDPAFREGVWRTLRTAGYWTGEAWDRRKNGNAYPLWVAMTLVHDSAETNQEESIHYVGMFSDMTERKAQEEKIQFLAHHDVLTGLPNRMLLQHRLTTAMSAADREGGLVGLLFIDLDRFKYINDTLGHTIGDVLLNTVADRLQKAVRSSDTVSRFGGDEFMVVLSKIRQGEDARYVAENIIGSLAPTYVIDGHRLSISPSIGITLYPNDANDIDTLVKNADAAMYQAKAKGRNTYQFYRPELTVLAGEHLSLEYNLRQAVDRDELVLYYQPQIDIATKQLIGVEALVRWQSPEHGLVPPAKFIPFAEESGLILQVGSWVMHEACRQKAEWNRLSIAHFPISINVSALQFRQPDFQERVVEILKIYGINGSDIEIELTESVVMEDAENTAKILSAFRELGVSLAIDDFGTGYSSLGYLKHLPIVKLKIDSSFVRDLETDSADRAIVEAIISLGRALELTLVAEGVENRQILGILSKNGCHVAQGYHYCRPIPANEFVQWMQEFEGRLAAAGQSEISSSQSPGLPML